MLKHTQELIKFLEELLWEYANTLFLNFFFLSLYFCSSVYFLSGCPQNCLFLSYLSIRCLGLVLFCFWYLVSLLVCFWSILCMVFFVLYGLVWEILGYYVFRYFFCTIPSHFFSTKFPLSMCKTAWHCFTALELSILFCFSTLFFY